MRDLAVIVLHLLTTIIRLAARSNAPSSRTKWKWRRRPAGHAPTAISESASRIGVAGACEPPSAKWRCPAGGNRLEPRAA